MANMASIILQAGHIYKTCTICPGDINCPSPLDGHRVPLPIPLQEGVPQSPLAGHRVPLPVPLQEGVPAIRSSRREIWKKGTCFLASYDVSSGIGVIFLGTPSVPTRPHRFLRIRGQSDIGAGFLETSPPGVFPDTVYINFTHPIKVRLIIMSPLPQNPFRAQLPGGPPPPVGVMPHDMPLPIRPVVFSPESTINFWAMHARYHSLRPVRAPALGGPPPPGASLGETPSVGGVRLPGILPRGVLAMGRSPAGVESWGEGGPTEDAPWGTVGSFRVGIDIPLITESLYTDSDSEDESDEDEPLDLCALDVIGTVQVSSLLGRGESVPETSVGDLGLPRDLSD